MEPILKSLKETRDNANSYINHLESEIAKTKAFLEKLPTGDSLVEGQALQPAEPVAEAPATKPKKASKKLKKLKSGSPDRPKRGALRAAVLEFIEIPRTKREIVDHVIWSGAIRPTTKNPTNSVNQIIYGKGVEKQGDKFVAVQN